MKGAVANHRMAPMARASLMVSKLIVSVRKRIGGMMVRASPRRESIERIRFMRMRLID